MSINGFSMRKWEIWGEAILKIVPNHTQEDYYYLESGLADEW